MRNFLLVGSFVAALIGATAHAALATDRSSTNVTVQSTSTEAPTPALVENSASSVTVQTTTGVVAPAVVQGAVTVEETTVPATITRTQMVPQVTQESVNLPAKTYTQTVIDQSALQQSQGVSTVQGFSTAQSFNTLDVPLGVGTVTTTNVNTSGASGGRHRLFGGMRRQVVQAGNTTTSVIDRPNARFGAKHRVKVATY